MSFNFRNFVKSTIMRMLGNDPTYRVMEYAANWHDKRVLTEDDMTEIETAIEAYEESLLSDDFPGVDEVAEMIEVFEEGTEETEE